MATPIVTVSFTADVQNGISPLAVQFTDTTEVTDGFVRERLWDFGDGSISEEENPLHTFSGDGGDKFTITLTVITTEGEFQAISSQTQNVIRISNERLIGVSSISNAEAFLARVSVPLDDGEPAHTHTFNGSQYFYFTNSTVLELKSPFGYEAFVRLQMNLDASINFISGAVFAEDIFTTPITSNWETHSRLSGVTNINPLTTPISILPDVELAGVSIGLTRGVKVQMRTSTFSETSTQVFGEHIEVDFIVLGSPPIAAFSAIPLVIPSGRIVTFINETIPATIGDTTYSWKKRISGSGDSFVEFSIQENPQETFIK